ncbi:MAG TPA: hypothetical protein VK196_15440 [Magnetospirillum sp.]|nr:hypothetical protein [Magnetospirillum sp.]
MALLALNQVTLATFTPHLNETFSSQTEGGEGLEFTLYQASAMPASDYPGKERDPFQLRFSAPSLNMLPQAIYRLQHATLGEIDVFLVPIRPEGDHYCYQAVFN